MKQRSQHNERPLRVIVSGGGTGGHVYPAIAIADELKRLRPDTEFLFVGAKGKLEMTKVPRAGYAIAGLWMSGLQRKLTLDNLAFPFKLLSSIWKSIRIVKRFQPDVVVGTGGYAGGPVLYAAAKMGVPTLIQEPNAFAGLANKWLGKHVDTVCVAFPGMERFFPKEKIVVTGNPVREGGLAFDKVLSPGPSPEERGDEAGGDARFARSGDKPKAANVHSPDLPTSAPTSEPSPLSSGEGPGERTLREGPGERTFKTGPGKSTPLTEPKNNSNILLMGGSGGARSLNQALRDNTEAIRARPQVRWTWQCGANYYDAFKSCATARLPNVTISAFIDDMAKAYATADVVIGRAGSTTIAEIQFLGKPTILVPSPWVAEDHQTMNARALTERDAAVLVADQDASEQLVPAVFGLLDDDARRETIGRNARAMANVGGVTRIANEVLNLISSAAASGGPPPANAAA